mmetsp:Transcript_21702/g.65042  ORF Transcript_21702/g.65042 Transcript_21702/m.65042 type:complete len:281 (-) Transcript_21702:55-897(-)
MRLDLLDGAVLELLEEGARGEDRVRLDGEVRGERGDDGAHDVDVRLRDLDVEDRVLRVRARHGGLGEHREEPDHREAAVGELALLVREHVLGGRALEAQGVEAQVGREAALEPVVAALEVAVGVVRHRVDLDRGARAEDLLHARRGHGQPGLGGRHLRQLREGHPLRRAQVARQRDAREVVEVPEAPHHRDAAVLHLGRAEKVHRRLRPEIRVVQRVPEAHRPAPGAVQRLRVVAAGAAQLRCPGGRHRRDQAGRGREQRESDDRLDHVGNDDRLGYPYT